MIEVRPAEKSDMPKILDLHVRSWRENYTKNISKEFLESSKVEENRKAVWSTRFNANNPNQYVAVAEYRNNFAGFVCIFLNKHEKMGTLIDNLHVEPEYRKMGIGTHLLNKAAKWIHENSKGNGVYLEVYSENGRAREFYKSIGGTQTTEQPFVVDAVDGGKTLSYHMQWKSPEILLANTKEKIGDIE